jgi:hypothetical protein
MVVVVVVVAAAAVVVVVVMMMMMMVFQSLVLTGWPSYSKGYSFNRFSMHGVVNYPAVTVLVVLDFLI